MNLTHRLERSFKPRFAVIYPFGCFVLFFCYLNKDMLEPGITLITTGLLLRLWANGYAIKNDKLTTSGPYAFVRNPLYLGTFLIAIGFVVVLKTNIGWLEPAVGWIFLLALCFMYYHTIKEEEGMLSAKFGQAYKNYCQKIPAMVPSLVAYKAGEKWPFSWQRLINSKEHKPLFWVFILLVVFHLKNQLLVEHKVLDPKSVLLIIIALCLIALDIAYECTKKKIRTEKI